MNNYTKKLLCLFLPLCIALYMTYPLLKGDYAYSSNEYDLYKSFLGNFIEILKHGELPVWNEYVGGGHPAMYFGHYPLTQNTLLYMLFGVSDFTYYMVRFLSIFVLLASFIYAGRLLKFGYLISLIGALVYFSINFVSRILIADTIGNLVLVYPLLIVLIFKIIEERQWKTILIFNLVYIFWLTGGHITYVYTHLIMLFVIYWISALTIDSEPFKASNFKKYVQLFFILFVIPVVAVLYQYYFVYDVIKASNRLKGGLIVSPFELIVWKQLLRSFQSSSYFWMGLLLIPLSWIRKSFKIPRNALIIAIGMLLYLTVIDIQFASASRFFADYIPLLNSSDFRIALLLYLILSCFIFKNYYGRIMRAGTGDFVIFGIYISLLSYYFYCPENISGYDYELFMELSIVSRVLIMVCILFSMRSFRKSRIVQILVVSLIILYLIRSHLTIPLMRFTGIVWYSVRDGSIFSPLFAFLFLFGLKGITDNYAAGNIFYRNTAIAKYVKIVMLMALVILLARDSFDKFYKGQSHKYVFPNNQHLAVTPQDIGTLKARKDIPALNALLLDLNERTRHFYRIFEPEGSRHHLAGYLQDHKIYEASLYESSISRDYKDFFDYTILGKTPPNGQDMKDILPHFVFAKHVHKGFNTSSTDIPYSDIYLFSAGDAPYLKNRNIGFFWDLMQVKYLVVGSAFSKALEEFSDNGNYKLLGSYPGLDLNVYEITKNKRYSKMGILPLGNEEDFNKVMEKINSGDVDVLRDVYARIIYLDKDNKDFTLLKSHTDQSGRYYEIDAKEKGMLIEFESWNRHWGLKVNKEKKKLYKAFTIFRGTRIEPGKNIIEMKYNVPYFKTLFILSIFAILTYVSLFVYITKRNFGLKL